MIAHKKMRLKKQLPFASCAVKDCAWNMPTELIFLYGKEDIPHQ